MAKGNSGLTTITAATPPDAQEPEVKVQPQEPEEPETDEKGFKSHDDSDYHDLYGGKAYYEQQDLTLDQKNAAETYTDPEVEGSYANPAADGLHSPSQDLNWAMSQGLPMSQAQETMLEYYYVVFLVNKLNVDKFLLNQEQLHLILNLKLQFMY